MILGVGNSDNLLSSQQTKKNWKNEQKNRKIKYEKWHK